MKYIYPDREDVLETHNRDYQAQSINLTKSKAFYAMDSRSTVCTELYLTGSVVVGSQVGLLDKLDGGVAGTSSAFIASHKIPLVEPSW